MKPRLLKRSISAGAVFRLPFDLGRQFSVNRGWSQIETTRRAGVLEAVVLGTTKRGVGRSPGRNFSFEKGTVRAFFCLYVLVFWVGAGVCLRSVRGFALLFALLRLNFGGYIALPAPRFPFPSPGMVS